VVKDWVRRTSSERLQYPKLFYEGEIMRISVIPIIKRDFFIHADGGAIDFETISSVDG
jgi:hypothetical protein